MYVLMRSYKLTLSCNLLLKTVIFFKLVSKPSLFVSGKKINLKLRNKNYLLVQVCPNLISGVCPLYALHS